GNTSINVLGVCNPNLEFIYCLSGWEGSAHDGRVLRDALSRPNGLNIPKGLYYLCDAGYTNCEGFLTPFRGQRCDADMTKRRRDENATENPRDYYKWTDQTDSVLVECMQDMAKQQQVENGQFKAGAFKEIEKMMEVLLVGHGIKASPHIKSRIKVLKKQFQIVQELRGLSGAGWNDELKCVNIEDSSFSEHVQNHSYCSGWNRKPFPLYDGLLAVSGKSRTNGKGALGINENVGVPDSRAPKDDHFEGINIDNVIPIVDEETNAGFEHQTNNGVDVTADNEKDKGTSACPTS
ncbi:hypothetical protein LINPERHAP2_LOCUS23374, partial [Linum perenne]